MGPLTFVYKKVGDVDITFDLYPRAPALPVPIESEADSAATLPLVVNFHGGGLTVGNTQSWFPSWLKGEWDLNIRILVVLTAHRSGHSGRARLSLRELSSTAAIDRSRYRTRYTRSLQVHCARS